MSFHSSPSHSLLDDQTLSGEYYTQETISIARLVPEKGIADCESTKRDNGYGVAPADRTLVCKRYCTRYVSEHSTALIGLYENLGTYLRSSARE